MANVVSFSSYPEVIGKHAPWWRAEIFGWGATGGGNFSNIVFPTGGAGSIVTPLASGAAVVTIGPDSTVDQVLVAYTNPVTGAQDSSISQGGDVNQGDFTVGYNRPSPVIPSPMQFWAAKSSQWGNAYHADGVNGTLNLTDVDFERPVLQLITYASLSAVPPYQQVRADMIRTISSAAGASTNPRAAWPIAGRRCAGLYVTCTGTLIVDIRVGRLIYHVTGQVGAETIIGIERVFATGTANAVTGANFYASTEQPGQFLTFWATATGGAGTVQAVLVASDIPCSTTV